MRCRNVLVPNCLFQRCRNVLVPNCLFQRVPNCLGAELSCYRKEKRGVRKKERGERKEKTTPCPPPHLSLDSQFTPSLNKTADFCAPNYPWCWWRLFSFFSKNRRRKYVNETNNGPYGDLDLKIRTCAMRRIVPLPYVLSVTIDTVVGNTVLIFKYEFLKLKETHLLVFPKFYGLQSNIKAYYFVCIVLFRCVNPS